MQLTRRQFVKTAGCGITALALPPALAREAHASGTGNVLVVAFLRGGADGLSLAIPQGDAHYPAIRPGIAVDPDTSLAITSSYAKAANRQIGMDDYFHLSPEWSGLETRFNSGELAIVQAVGGTGSYSHFTAQDGMEKADPGDPVAPSGWLHRAIAQLANPTAMSGVALASRSIVSLDGPDQSIYVGLPSFSSFTLNEAPLGGRRALLEGMYSPSRLLGWNTSAQHALGLLGGSTAELFGLIDAIETAGLTSLGNQLSAPYAGLDNPSWARAMRDAAALIKADSDLGGSLGVRVIALDLGGWDHHSALTAQTGARARELSQVLNAFMIDLIDKEVADRTLLLAMSEFGRTAFENGNSGADHGHGCVMLALSGAGSSMLGGRVLTRADDDGSDVIGWPGLGPGDLHTGQTPKYAAEIDQALIDSYLPDEQGRDQRDLAVTIDFRDVMGEVLIGHLGLTAAQVSDANGPLLGHNPTPLPDGGLFAVPDPA